MKPLSFLDKLRPSPVVDLLTCDIGSIPPVPGVYILMATTHLFTYPGGDSAVYYVGESTKGLKERLAKHRGRIRFTSGPKRHMLHNPLYEYGAKFGARFAYVCLDATTATSAKKLEYCLLARFAAIYRTAPVANDKEEIKKLKLYIRTEESGSTISCRL